ncbi:MAG TPA: sigma 54-interacting transcriptional regulator, partial [Clostridia bacterium]|nr:sigma 54-interacting transcriptional regulator [Clostridia bacterium]
DELAAFNSVHNLVIGVDGLGRINIFNKTCERIFNISASEALGKLITELIPYTGLLKVLKTGKPHIGRKFVFGKALYVINRTPVVRDGKIIGALGVGQDISELQDVVNELETVKELKGTLETILETGNDGYLVVNNDDCITMINKPFADLIGIEPKDAVGKKVSELIENKQLHVIPTEGSSQVGEVIKFKNRDAVTMRYPIKKEGEIIGSVSKVIFKDVNELIELAEQANKLNKELNYYKAELDKVRGVRYNFDSLIAEDPAMLKSKETAARVAQGPSTVLIRGESGTGKELFAHAIHAGSSRRAGPFIKVNCVAIPESLLESELFGYQEGAFTGAKKGGQIGKFEQANGGTIFLDEIGDMPPVMQAKLLRVLQEKEIERLGDNTPRYVDVRVVTATNRDLEKLIQKGEFRDDLYYRLNVVSLVIPPLRERMKDLRPLVLHFVEKMNHEFGIKVDALAPEVWEILESYPWPGNVRELENVIERAFNVVNGTSLEVNHLPLYLRKHTGGKPPAARKALAAMLEEVEREAIREAIEATNGNKMQAAKILGISRAWLYKKIKQYNLNF